MPRGFTGRCYTCGGWGHKAYECQSHRLVDNQYPVAAGHSSAHHANASTVPEALNRVREGPRTQDLSALGASKQNALEVEAEASAAAYAMHSDQATRRAEKRLRRMRIPLNLTATGLSGARGDRPLQQSGSGALPGARTEQRNRSGAGLLGPHWVEKPVMGRGKRRRDPIEGEEAENPIAGRRWRRLHPIEGDAVEDKEERVPVGAHSVPTRGQQKKPNAEAWADQRQWEGRLHWTAPEYQAASGEAVGMNLQVDEAYHLIDCMAREHPQGNLVSLNIFAVTAEKAENSALPNKIIKGRFRAPILPTAERQPSLQESHQDTQPREISPRNAAASSSEDEDYRMKDTSESEDEDA